MAKRLAILLVAALVVAGAYAGWRVLGARGASESAPLVLSGNVDVHQVELAFRVGGRIARLAVEEGARVESGALLGQLDKVPLSNDVRAAEADVALAQAQLAKVTHGFRVEEIGQARQTVAQRRADVANARGSRARIRELAAQGMATRQQRDDADARLLESEATLRSATEQLNLVTRGSRPEDIDAAEATLDAAQARLDRAKIALADADLVASSRGIVAVKAREVGAIVQPGQTVYTLALVDPVWIRAYVPQPRLGRIKPGMKVSVAVDSMPGKRYEGTVGFVSPEAEFTPKTVQTQEVRDDLVYRIRVVAPDPDNVFRQGMPVTVYAGADASPP